MKCPFQSTQLWNHAQIKVIPSHCLIQTKFYWYIHSTTTIITFSSGGGWKEDNKKKFCTINQ